MSLIDTEQKGRTQEMKRTLLRSLMIFDAAITPEILVDDALSVVALVVARFDVEVAVREPTVAV